MKTLLIATDLGQLRAYLVAKEESDPSPTIDLIRESDFPGRRHQFSDRDTDQAGRFSTGAGGSSSGEQHEEIQEQERVRTRHVAAAVADLAGAQPDAEVYFAAPKMVHRQIVSLLSSPVQKRIRKSLELDLVKMPKRELLQRFERM